MIKPKWINLESCLSAHEKLLQNFGGLAGIRDEGLLLSALARPEQLFHYEKPTVFALAASYALGIVKNHPFLDGNKRTGFITAALFLQANGHLLIASEEEAVIYTFGLAASKISEEEFATWLEKNTRPI